ncbi:YncE family protein [Mycolicibacterium insubricum]|uniref:YncE family protein n=1 Tax=Mycolicibacterium insubricum TaxID=444597 RepID=UPI0013D6998B|nr:hypothetical protein [Mycolicibacterium insubricum]
MMANKARALDLTAGSTGALAESSVAPLSRWSPVAADMTASRADVGRGPIAGIALDASAGQLYVTNPADGSVAVLDIDTMAVTQVITDLPEAHAVGAAGGSVYVSIVSLDTDAVSIVDTALQSGEEALADIYPVKETVRDLALSPEGERIYLASAHGSTWRPRDARGQRPGPSTCISGARGGAADHDLQRKPRRGRLRASAPCRSVRSPTSCWPR